MGVKVKVGRGVSEGGMVGVSVGEEVEVTVAGGVGEAPSVGSAVQAGASAGVGEATNLNPPQAMRKRASPEIQIKNLLIIASYLAQSGGRSPETKHVSKAIPFPKVILLNSYEIASS